MKLYNTTCGLLVTRDDQTFASIDASLDELLSSGQLRERCEQALAGSPSSPPQEHDWVAPIASQEVWAAGVTYFRSRNARMEESKDAGGGTFYDRVYEATRPELFFKATPQRVVGPNGNVRIRSDATWSVPEPELTLVLDSRGNIAGYTIGNEMSSRDIEGENPLYLPQAKVYDGSCALGPCILIAENPLPKSTTISVKIYRGDQNVFTGQTTLAELKRDPQELAAYLFRECSFPYGAFLMTGTGIVPDDTFTLAHGDVIAISIEGIGTLRNTVT